MKAARRTRATRRKTEDPAILMIRKEKPQPRPKPPAPQPAPGGMQAPGTSNTPGRIICADAAESTVLESKAQQALRRPSALGGKSIHIMVIEGGSKGQAYDITGIGTYTIGRKECDIILEDEKVSRKHASIIVAREGHYAVTDLASRNGTFVNGVRLTRRNLQHNDLIRVGDTTLRFTVFDGPVPVEN